MNRTSEEGVLDLKTVRDFLQWCGLRLDLARIVIPRIYDHGPEQFLYRHLKDLGFNHCYTSNVAFVDEFATRKVRVYDGTRPVDPE